jgi:hypothetical protein
MTNQEQSFFEGFAKRASEYGFDYSSTVSLWKQSAMKLSPAATPMPPVNPVAPITPGLHLNVPQQPPVQPAPKPAAPAPASEQLIFENPSASKAPKRSIDSYYAPVQPNPAPGQQAAQPRPLPSAVAPTDNSMAQYSPATLAGDQQMLNAPISASNLQYQQGVDNNTLKRLMGSYNHGSRLDRAKAEAIRQMYSPGMRAKDVYNNPAYQAASRRFR